MIRKITRVFILVGAFFVGLPLLALTNFAISPASVVRPPHLLVSSVIGLALGSASILAGLGVRRKQRWGPMLLAVICWVSVAAILVGLVQGLSAQFLFKTGASHPMWGNDFMAWVAEGLVVAFALWVCVWLASVARLARRLHRRYAGA